jgi:hypothetical protein
MQDDEQAQIATVTDRLATGHPEVDRTSIEAAVHDAYQGYATSRIRDFVPLLVEREAVDRLSLRGGRRHP